MENLIEFIKWIDEIKMNNKLWGLFISMIIFSNRLTNIITNLIHSYFERLIDKVRRSIYDVLGNNINALALRILFVKNKKLFLIFFWGLP